MIIKQQKIKTQNSTNRVITSANEFTCNKVHLLLAFIIVFISAFYTVNTIAGGQLMVSPTRIVFEGNERTKQVNLINNGSETGRFRISFVNRKMTENGNFEEVPENEPGMYSSDIVRFSPRQVTLGPGQSQTVRLMLRKKREMEDGEYRSHLLFQSLPDPQATDISKLAGENKGLSVHLIPIIGVTIPVIVRQGDLDYVVSLSDFELKQANTVKAEKTLSFKINREGKSSAYGDLRVYFTPEGGEPVVVGQINGVAVYTPLTSRTVDIMLQTPPGFNLSNGELYITYLEPGKDESTGILAQSRLSIP